MKYQRRDTSVLFSLSDLTAPSQTEAQKREQAAVPLDIREVAEEMRATRDTDDPFRRFDRATDRTTQPDALSRPAPVTISIPVVKRRKSRQLLYPILSALVTAGLTVGVMLYLNNSQPPQVMPPTSAEGSAEATAPATAPAATPKPAEPAPKAAVAEAAAAADAKGSEPPDTGNTIALASPPAEKAPEATAPAKKPVAEKPKEEKKKASSAPSRSRKRKSASSSKSSPAPAKAKAKPERASAPPPPAPKKKSGGGDDINALLSGIRNERGKATSVDASLPDKPSMGQIKSVVKRYQGKINACNKAAGGAEAVRVMTKVDISGSSGAVTKARVLTPPFSTNAVGACIQGVFKTMNFGRFRRASFTFRYPIFLQ